MGLYPIISLFEITLRNHINNALNQQVSNAWILNQEIVSSIFKDKELSTYYETYKELSKKKQITEGRLIAELNLGFWVNLFNKKYKVDLWHKKNMFELTFPHFDIKTSNRTGYIFPKLKEVQYIRNRISHHEAIFDYPKGINNCYNNVLVLLSWLSPEIRELAEKISNFTEIWEEKADEILKRTSSLP